ncbi:MAG TPA: T9SS type A sorting domain-containing protein [Candidatus Kapabacteria bacterium]|nr:T9SS type A sorting domain-containing protein [Candidatus Kapabacteria bacterium]
MKYFFAVVLTLLIASSAFGQTSWFDITIDTTTGAYTRIDSLPGVTGLSVFSGLTYDQHHSRFILDAYNIDGSMRLMSVDAASGHVISEPSLPDGSNGILFSQLNYDPATDTLCAMGYQSIGNQQRLVIATLNTLTAAYSTIDSLHGVSGVGLFQGAIDGSGNFTFLGYDTNKVSRLYTYQISPTTISLQANPKYPSHDDSTNTIVGYRYDYTYDSLYAFMYTTGSKHNYLIAADPINGAITVIDSFPDMSSVSPYSMTYDQAGHRYIFIAFNNDKHVYLYSVNTVTGAFTQNELFPVAAETNPDVYIMQYDSASGKIYAITYGSTATGVQESLPRTPELQAFPNPSNAGTNISLNGTYENVTALITNSLGQTLRKDIFHGASEINIQRGGLPDGLYFVQLTGDGKYIGTVKLGVE